MEESAPINADVVSVPTNGIPVVVAEDKGSITEYGQRHQNSIDKYKPKRRFLDYIIICLRAYGASLVESLVGVPIVASAVTLGLYFSQSASGWYTVVFGALYTYIAWLLIAVILVYFSTFEGGNARSYGLITTRLRQLEVRLDEMNAQYLDEKSTNLAEYQLEALREANESFEKSEKYISALQSSKGADENGYSSRD